jgi:hypothetical protein
MRTLHFVLGLVFFFEVSALAQVQVWITPNPAEKDGSGTGTSADPYICSSAATFDALMKSPTIIPGNSVIHLGAGTFSTQGSIPLKPGCKFRGAGMDVTTVKIVPFTSYATPSGTLSNYEARVIGIPPYTYCCNGVEVSDLTVDCNLQNQTLAVAIGAVWLQGGNTKISRVKAINWGSKNGNECFIFGIGSGGKYFPAVRRCLIENCIVEQPAPVSQRQGADGFVIVGEPADRDQWVIGSRGWILGAEIRNCRVHDIHTGAGVGEPEYFSGMGIGNGVSGARIDGNVAINLGGNNSAVYDSCGSLVDCGIENNMFLNVGNGVNFAGDDYCPANTNALKENIQVKNNFITVQTGGNGVVLSGIFGHAITNLVIMHNMIQAGDGAGAIHCVRVSTVKNLTVQNNVLDANGGTVLGIANDVTVSRMTNNPDFSGSTSGQKR